MIPTFVCGSMQDLRCDFFEQYHSSHILEKEGSLVALQPATVDHKLQSLWILALFGTFAGCQAQSIYLE